MMKKERDLRTKEPSVKQEDVSRIMNAINDALESVGYEAVGYENTDAYLDVLIDRVTGGGVSEEEGRE